VLLGIGTAVAQILRLPASQVSSVAIESGFQNGTVGIAVGALLMMVTSLPDLAWRCSIQPMADPSVIEL
jgi:BASS family bile acid:Na+ symporter